SILSRDLSTMTVQSVRIGDLSVLRALPKRSQGAPVLFVHGYFADATVFSGWIELFAEHGWPSYAVHLRGRGGSRSDVNLGRASVADFVADAAAAARALEKPIVIGHSMGG